MAVFPEFEVRQVEDPKKSEELGHMAFREEEWVKMHVDTRTVTETKMSDALEIWERNARNGDAAARAWLEHYRAWKADEEAPIEGTPLSEWPYINKGQFQQCKKIGLRSIEQVANAEENDLRNINQGRKLKYAAQAFLETAADKGKVAGEVVELRKQNKFLEDKLHELTAQVEELSKSRKPGRPKKQEVEEDGST